MGLLIKAFIVLIIFLQFGYSKHNVLFIAIDDMRPQTNSYGETQMITPNLDNFSTSAVQFNRHYVQAPTCGASRYYLLTGRRDHTTSNDAIRNKMKNFPDPESMPHLFKMNGYYTAGIGKISHYVDGKIYAYNGTGNGEWEMPRSWDEFSMPYEPWGYAWASFFAYANGMSREGPNALNPEPLVEFADVPDTGYPDGLIAEEAIKKLGELKDSTFFLGVGFFKPHLPFTAPKKYGDLYNRDQLDLTVFGSRASPTNSSQSGEINRYDMAGATGDASDRLRLHGYYACVSYVDVQVGKVLKALDSLGLSNNTIVVIWGDHGWHLGENNIWGKHNTKEWALRSLMMMRVPGMATGETEGIIETIDIYPTLAELCSLQVPNTVGGESFSYLFKNPNLPGKSAAFGYWNGGRVTMRTDQYRYTEGNVIELYDHNTDRGEETNIAGQNQNIVNTLSTQLTANAPSFPRVPGCMDTNFVEYNPNATVENGSCATPVSVNKQLGKNVFIIQKNNDIITVTSYNNSKLNIKLLDFSGKMIQMKSGTNKIQLKKPLNKGLYILKIQSGSILRNNLLYIP